MGFRLVPKSVTLNDLERRNGRLVFSERELKFMFAICHRRSVCRLSSVCRL